MLNNIILWEGWNVLNTVSQLLLAIAAFITINITLKQIGNGYKCNLYSEVIVTQNENEKHFGIEITNLGLSYVYVKEVSIRIKEDNKRNKYKIHLESKIINPGESILGYMKDNVFQDILVIVN